MRVGMMSTSTYRSPRSFLTSSLFTPPITRSTPSTFWKFGAQNDTTTSGRCLVHTPPISVTPVRLSISTTSATALT
jgi:hypothetical protein